MTLPLYYLDTSVIGGYFDPEFQVDTRAFFLLFTEGKAKALTSDLTTEELLGAPQRVRDLLLTIPPTYYVTTPLTDEARDLQRAYLEAKVLSRVSYNDALHVAIATIVSTTAIVSWNFKHLVRYDKIKGFNEVNNRLGYPPVEILSPKEVMIRENQKEIL